MFADSLENKLKEAIIKTNAENVKTGIWKGTIGTNKVFNCEVLRLMQKMLKQVFGKALLAQIRYLTVKKHTNLLTLS